MAVSLSPRGIARRGTPTLSSRAEEGHADLFVRFDKTLPFTVDGKEVFASETPVIQAQSEGEAQRWWKLLEELRALDEPHRSKAIERCLAEMLDAGQATESFGAFWKQTAWLRWSCNYLFFLLFLVAPLAVIGTGLERALPRLLVLLVLLVAIIAWNFRRLHRRFYPQDSEARWTALMTIILFPPAAIRAGDVLFRDLFAASHPLAVCRALCTNDAFRNFAARTLREAMFPMPAASLAEDPERTACEQWFREKLTAAIRGFITEAGLAPGDLLAPPAKQSLQCVSYCPRCCQQFTVQAGSCADCGGLALVPLPE
jgi:hypothetical protein